MKNYLPYGLSGFDKDGAPGNICIVNQSSNRKSVNYIKLLVYLKYVYI